MKTNDAILDEINDTTRPTGITDELFNSMKRELVRTIKSRTSDDPLQKEFNQVIDLKLFVQNGKAVLLWSYALVGDCDQNGEVGISDLTPLGRALGKKGPFEYTSVYSLYDGDGNGEINVSDIAAIGQNFGAKIESYQVYCSSNKDDYPRTVDGKNGPGTIFLGEVPSSRFLFNTLRIKRARIQFEIEDYHEDMYYWVRAKAGESTGIRSNMASDPPDVIGPAPLPNPDEEIQPELLWEFQTYGPGELLGNPVIGPDGSVYVRVGTSLHALSNTGELMWKSNSIESGFFSLYVSQNCVYILGNTGNMYSFDFNGKQKWVRNYRAEVATCRFVAADSKDYFYLGFSDGYLRSYDDNGDLRWSIMTGDSCNSTTAVTDQNNRIFFTSEDENLYCLNHDGSLEWVGPDDDFLGRQMNIGQDGTLYICSNSSMYYAINSNGLVLWTYRIDEPSNAQPIVFEDGSSYIRSMKGVLSAFDSEGNLKWEHVPVYENHRYIGNNKYENSIVSINNDLIGYHRYDHHIIAFNRNGDVAWDHDYTAYPRFCPISLPTNLRNVIYSTGYQLVFLNENGSLLSTYMAGGIIKNDPLITEDGCVVFGCSDGWIYTLDHSGNEVSCYRDPDGDYVINTPLFGIGDIYYALYPDFLQAQAANGSILWKYSCSPTQSLFWRTDGQTRHSSSVVQDVDGTLYFGGCYGKLYAVAPSGTEKWQIDLGDICVSTPSIHPNGSIIVVTNEEIHDMGSRVIAVSRDGFVLWESTIESTFVSDPVVNESGDIYCVGISLLYCYDEYGNVKHIYNLDPIVGSNITANNDDVLCLCNNRHSRNSFLMKFNSDGQYNTISHTDDVGAFTVEVDKYCTIYLGCSDGNIIAIRENGCVLWEFDTGGSVITTLSIGKFGTIFAGNEDGKVYMLNAKPGKG